MANIILDGTTLNGVTYLDVPKVGGGTARFSEGGGGGNYQSKSKTYTPSGSSQSETITSDAGYDALSSVAITVNAAPSGSAKTPATTITANPTISVNSSGLITATVSKTQSVTPTVSTGWVSSGTAGNITVSGSGTEQLTVRDSSDLDVDGPLVTAPAGYYASSASTYVASGTAGIPTATKGTVSSHSVNVTPTVTNYEGYIVGGAKVGTAVTVTASELVSGSQTITQNNTYDVTNLASVTVNVPADSPNLQSKAVTYSVDNITRTYNVSPDIGYDGLSSVDVTVNALDLQSKTVTPTESLQDIRCDNGYDGLDTVTVNPIPSEYIVPDGNFAITSNGSGIDISSFATVSVEVPASVATKTSASLSSTTTTLSISGLLAKPAMWALQLVISSGSYVSGASTRYITSALCSGDSTVYSTCIYKSGSTAREYGYNTCTWSYNNNGTITFTSPGTSTAGGFRTGSTYRLFYAY